MGWTHSICDDCWTRQEPDRNPSRVKKSYRKGELCCWCGIAHKSGIYLRNDPAALSCEGRHP